MASPHHVALLFPVKNEIEEQLLRIERIGFLHNISAMRTVRDGKMQVSGRIIRERHCAFGDQGLAGNSISIPPVFVMQGFMNSPFFEDPLIAATIPFLPFLPLLPLLPSGRPSSLWSSLWSAAYF